MIALITDVFVYREADAIDILEEDVSMEEVRPIDYRNLAHHPS